jgi:pimeloyl-ACP methyl ester carboxylesterase
MPVVLLHGLFGRGQNFGGLARRLATKFRVVSMDLRNHGASAHAFGMDYVTLAGDVMATLSALSIAQAALLGHSMGGKAAMAAALMSPSRVLRLLVADIAPVAYRHGNAAIVAALRAVPLRAGMTRGEADAALAGAVPDAAMRAFLLTNLQLGSAPFWRIGLAEIAAAVGDLQGWPAVAGAYPGPALFVRGERSDYVGAAEAAAITALFPQARLVTIADAGHWVHADQPQAFADLVEAFLG